MKIDSGPLESVPYPICYHPYINLFFFFEKSLYRSRPFYIVIICFHLYKCVHYFIGKLHILTLKFRFFHIVDKYYFNPRVDLDISTFSRGRQKRIFL